VCVCVCVCAWLCICICIAQIKIQIRHDVLLLSECGCAGYPSCTGCAKYNCWITDKRHVPLATDSQPVSVSFWRRTRIFVSFAAASCPHHICEAPPKIINGLRVFANWILVSHCLHSIPQHPRHPWHPWRTKSGKRNPTSTSLLVEISHVGDCNYVGGLVKVVATP